MKNRMIALAVFASTLAGGGVMIASNAFAQTSPPPAPPAAGKVDKHPELRKALRQLAAVKQTLDHSAWDFAGHKTDASKDIQQAIDELHKAMKDAKH